MEAWCFLLDFFLAVVLVAGAAAEELPDGDEALDCCGCGMREAAIAARADVGVKLAHARDAKTSDAAIEGLFIFLRCSSLLATERLEWPSVRRAYMFFLL